MMRVLRTASGIASRCGSNAPLRVIGALAAIASAAWLAAHLWGWAIAGTSDGRYFVAVIASLAYVVGSLVTMGVMSDPPRKWTLATMTGYAPFVLWRAMISDGRVTAWKMLLWLPLVPAEGLICLWLAIGWLVRLLDIDLSKR